MRFGHSERVTGRLGWRDLLALAGALMLAPAALARPPVFPSPDRELMVPVEGGRVYVRINGTNKAGKLPIVLIHGGPGSIHTGLLDALELADERMVILYDQLDSGRSDQPNDSANWKVAHYVGELEAVRAALGIAKWHVFGHSWGGTVALEYGARRPAALAGLVLASPLISTRSWIRDANALRAKLPAQVQATLTRCEGKVPPPKAQCEAATTAFNVAFNRREQPSAASKAYRHPQNRGSNPRLYETMWGSSEFVATGTLRSYDGEALLGRLDGPSTLFLVGQHDEARPVTAEAFAERVAGAEFGVVPGAAHGIFSDRPDETVAILRAWLARQDGKARR
jgi:proline iminopeptidase/L-proline amide hydrolase